MALSAAYCSLKADQSWKFTPFHFPTQQRRISSSNLRGTNAEVFRQRAANIGTTINNNWSFLGGTRVALSPNLARFVQKSKATRVKASWFTNSQIANNVFTLGTVAVLPFYTLMVVAPKAELTKKSMESAIPYIVLGLLYAYLLYLSWAPDTLQIMFASKYLLPELPGVAQMFSREMTLASAWIHLLAVDLFAARVKRGVLLRNPAYRVEFLAILSKSESESESQSKSDCFLGRSQACFSPRKNPAIKRFHSP